MRERRELLEEVLGTALDLDFAISTCKKHFVFEDDNWRSRTFATILLRETSIELAVKKYVSSFHIQPVQMCRRPISFPRASQANLCSLLVGW